MGTCLKASYMVYFSNVKDIHSVIEVTVLDENKYGIPDFLGKVAIPLLKVGTHVFLHYEIILVLIFWFVNSVFEQINIPIDISSILHW